MALPPEARPGTDALARLSWMATLAALAGLAGLFLLGPPPRLGDYAEWSFQAGVLLAKLTNPASVQGFGLAPYPVPNSFVTLAGALLGAAVGVIPAARLLLVVYLAAWVPALRRLLARHGRENDHALLTALVWMAALSTQFWNGFINYQFGLLFLTVYLAGGDKPSRLRDALLGVLIFFCHAGAFAFFTLAVLILGGAAASCTDEDGRLRRILSMARTAWREGLPRLLPSGLLAVWYVVGRAVTGYVSPQPDAMLDGIGQIILYKGYTVLRLGPFHNFILPEGSSAIEGLPGLYWLGCAGNAACAALLALILLRAAGHARGTVSRKPLLGLGLAGIAAFALLPYNAMGLFNPGERLLLPAMLVLLLLPAPRAPLRWLGLSCAGLGLATIVIYGSLAQHPAPTRPVELNAAAQARENVNAWEYNARLYAATRQRLFNARPFAFAERYAWIERGDYPELGFTTGMFTSHRP